MKSESNESSKRNSNNVGNLNGIIIQTILDKKPDSVKLLVNSVHNETKISRKIILKQIILLQQCEKINLANLAPNNISQSSSIVSKTKWYFYTMTIAIVCILFVLLVPQTDFPLVYGRYVFGSIFVLILPGYSFIRVLYVGKEIDNIERFGLSIVLSIGLSGIVSFLLNFSPWRITFLPIVFFLSILVIIFATLGVVRELWSNDDY